MPQITSDAVDRLITLEMRPLGIPRGVMPDLYTRIREVVGEPLTLRSARRLLEVPAGSTVLIATGAGAKEVLPKGETDGPLGAAALARILTLGLRLRPVLLTTTGYEEPLAAALNAYETPAEILSLPADCDGREATETAATWFGRYKPVAAIAVEQKGAAADGKYYFMTARECTVDARLDRVFALAPMHGIVTFGIGDGGNEVGFGRFGDAVRAAHPHGATIASTVATDEFIVAAISNWGCYGLEAMLAYLLEQPELLHGPEMGTLAMRACAEAGGGDGIYTKPIPFEDGQPSAVHVALMTLLHQIITNGLTRVEHALAGIERSGA